MNVPLDIRRRLTSTQPAESPLAPIPTKKARAKRGTGVVSKRKQRSVELYANVERGDGRLSAVIPLKVETETNFHQHWRIKQKRVHQQFAAVQYMIPRHYLPTLPVAVSFVRYGVKSLDTDNLVSAFKHVRDCIAGMYGCGDGPNDPITWNEPTQECVGEYAIRVTIDSTAPAPAAAAGEVGKEE